MTTAHRPTWTPAKGQSSRNAVPSLQISAKDLPGYTKLKLRQPGQGTKEEISQFDLKEKLEQKERTLKKLPALRDQEEPTAEVEHKPKFKQEKNIDADDSDSSDEDEKDEDEDKDDDDSDSDSDEDEEDEEAELMRELERIKREREEEALRKQREEEDRARRQQESQLLKNNPLLEETGFVIKRKWYDDGIFKNQAKTEKNIKKRFINDTVRNDFHRKFLDKYIQ
eukprot:TRINITY_DN10622_c0_g1_i1.p1 TRINITY_DN10622_c0_g1~~TRINITY_DN10622_c0_g1_i1.p1  ORF type:complete len:225 (-),score=88.80 TRINITY_DN10622_c0_g1_i1:27-701(-)